MGLPNTASFFMKYFLFRLINNIAKRSKLGSAKSVSGLYRRIGGEKMVRAIANSFYDIMDSDPTVQQLRAIHPTNLSLSREKLYLFLVGWIGGPPLYQQQYGHPRLRQRHLPFNIDQNMVSQWLYCMAQALNRELGECRDNTDIYQRLTQLAYHMINQPPASTTNPEA